MTRERLHFESLDALRGVAAIAVVVYHMVDTAKFGYTHGYLAVDFFFLLSGFVIGLAYEPRLLDGLSVKNFMIIRALRLLPMLAIGSMLGLIVTSLGFAHTPPGLWMIPAFLLLPVLWGKALYPLNIVFWSILTEVIANLGHAVSVKRLTNRVLLGALVVIGLLFLGIMAVRPHVGALWGPAPGFSFLAGLVRTFFSYAFGVWLSRMAKAGRLPKIRIYWPLLLLICAVVLLLPPSVPTPWLDIFAIYLLFPLIIIAGVSMEPPARLVGFAKWLGGISFPLYAIHVPFIELGLHFIAPGYWPAWLLLLIATLGLATVADRWIDYPIRTKISSRRRNDTVRAAPAAETEMVPNKA